MAEESQDRLSLEVQAAGEAAVVHFRGTAGMDEAGAIGPVLEQLAARRAPLVVLELSEMDFICSMALGAIISAHLKVRRYDGHVVLVDPQPIVRNLLEKTRLTKLFPIYPSVDAALAH